MAASSPVPQRQRDVAAFVPGVHAARALAVLLVLAAHVVGLWTNQEKFIYPPWQAYLGLVINPFRVDHQAGGHMGLLLFFLVSGYIVSQAAERDGRLAFFVKRAARLLPAMMLAVAATLLVAKFDAAIGVRGPEEFVPATAFSWHAISEAVGLGPTFGGIAILFVLWTLNVEYQWYALLGAGIDAARARPVASTVAMMAVCLLLVRAMPSQLGGISFSAENMTYVFVILIGRWAFLADRRVTSARIFAVGIIACVVLYAATRWPYDGADLFTGRHPHIVAVLWASAIFLVLTHLVRGRLWRPVQFVGDVSYGIYLFHVPIMWLVLPVISPGGRLFTIGAALTVALVMAAAWASYRFVETPVRRAARRWLEARASRGVLGDPIRASSV